MREIFLHALEAMEDAFRRLELQVPPPQLERLHSIWGWRYKEQLVEQAIIQKLARQVSGLHAIDVLLLKGLVQEQAVLQRTLDEIGEDIFFLSLALTNDRVTPLHERYLAAFWQEEFDHPEAIKSTQKRDMVPRKSIRAYNHRIGGLPDPQFTDHLGQTISKGYSGYVHAASPHIMDMVWGPEHPQFRLSGMRGTPLLAVHLHDAWNYYLRGLMSLAIAAKAFGDGQLVDHLYEALAEYEKTEALRNALLDE